MNYKFDTFISYAREDYQVAETLYKDLKNQRFIVWFDREEILPGQNWTQEIEEAISNSWTFIPLISKHSINKRGYVQKEIKIALELLDRTPSKKIFVIPARIDECEPKNSQLNHIQWVDLFPSWKNAIQQISKSIEKTKNKIKKLGINTKDEKINDTNALKRISSLNTINAINSLRALATKHYVSGRYHEERGDLNSAFREYIITVELRLEVVKMSSDTALYKRELGTAYHKLGEIEQKLKEYSSAQEHYQEALKIRSEVLEESPNEMLYIRELAVAHHKCGDLENMLGNDNKVKEHFEKALECRKKVVEMDKIVEKDREKGSD